MKPRLPNATQRTVLQQLRTDEWRPFAKMGIVVGDKLLERLIALGWIERRRENGLPELKLTAAGFKALTAKIPEEFPSSLAKKRATASRTGPSG
jgi:hypothetical protein